MDATEPMGRWIDVERVVMHPKFIVLLDDHKRRKAVNDELKKELRHLEITDRNHDKEFDKRVKEFLKEKEILSYIAFHFYDIALMKLKERIVPVFNETHYIVNSICLPKSGITNKGRNESLVVMGMGATHRKSWGSNRLKKGVVTNVDPDLCGNWTNNPDYISPSICVNYGIMERRAKFPYTIPLLNASVCYGDSGPPSHQYYGSQAVQIGVVTHSITSTSNVSFCGNFGQLLIRVSLFMPWIRSHISGTDETIEPKVSHLLIISAYTFTILGVVICSALIWCKS